MHCSIEKFNHCYCCRSISVRTPEIHVLQNMTFDIKHKHSSRANEWMKSIAKIDKLKSNKEPIMTSFALILSPSSTNFYSTRFFLGGCWGNTQLIS